MITTQLNHERVALMSVAPMVRLIRETTAWAAQAPWDDRRAVLDVPWVRAALARAEAEAEVLKLMCWQQAWRMGLRQVRPAEASAIKVFGSECYVRTYRTLMQVLGEAGALKRGSPGAALQGEVERYYRATLVLTFGGGTNEVQRDIISQAGLGLPRGRR